MRTHDDTSIKPPFREQLPAWGQARLPRPTPTPVEARPRLPPLTPCGGSAGAPSPESPSPNPGGLSPCLAQSGQSGPGEGGREALSPPVG